MYATTDPLTSARAAALFVSSLSATEQPTRTEAARAIRESLRTRGGTRGCVADMAARYGEYPELAAARMRWARGVVESLYEHRRAPVVHLAARRCTNGAGRVPGPTGQARAA
jgi:hypothetical protein